MCKERFFEVGRHGVVDGSSRYFHDSSVPLLDENEPGGYTGHMNILIQLLVAGGVMGLLDFLWLGVIAKKLYYSEMGSILLEKPNMPAALLFYVIYIIGIVVFVVMPALKTGSLGHAAGYGALFGLVAYATYDLTSLAVVKGFNVKIVAIDLVWGMVLTSVVATVTYLVVHTWFR